MHSQVLTNTEAAKTSDLQSEDGRIAYSSAGSGPLVICVPSMGDVRAEYRYLQPQLVAASYTAVAMDVRGHGESSTAWADYTVAGVGRDILALIRHLDRGPAAVVGTSMAAGAGVYAAAEAPGLVSGLALVGPFVRDIPAPGYMKLLYRVLFARPWGAAVWVRYYATLYPTSRPSDFAIYTAALGANLREPGRLAALRGMLLASKAAAEERLPRVAAPVLVVMGSKDPDFKSPQAEAALVANRLRGELRMIAGAGHYPHAEMPGQTGPVITAFLDRLRAATGAAGQ